MYWNFEFCAGGTMEIWLIETWDVLKCLAEDYLFMNDKINRNMRCIEMVFPGGKPGNMESD